jgi:hypothetical protein
MAFYYFELIGGRTFVDAGGYECKTLQDAKDIARGLAIRLASSQHELIGRGIAVAVRSQNEEEVYRVALDAVNRLIAH